MAIYKGIFEKKEDVLEEFTDRDWSTDQPVGDYNPDLEGCNILFAYYEQANYEGSAFVLFERDGQLYEVNGGHCSCYGLEGQWDPEETSVEALEHRIREGGLGSDNYNDYERFDQELLFILKNWRLFDFVQHGEVVH